MRRYSTPILIMSVSSGETKKAISQGDSKKTRNETKIENAVVIHTAIRIPRRIRSTRPAPKFCAINVEKAFPKSCTGIYAKESIFTAAAKAAITAVPKLFTSPCTIRIPKFITDCCTPVKNEYDVIFASDCLLTMQSVRFRRNSGKCL